MTECIFNALAFLFHLMLPLLERTVLKGYILPNQKSLPFRCLIMFGSTLCYILQVKTILKSLPFHCLIMFCTTLCYFLHVRKVQKPLAFHHFSHYVWFDFVFFLLQVRTVLKDCLTRSCTIWETSTPLPLTWGVLLQFLSSELAPYLRQYIPGQPFFAFIHSEILVSPKRGRLRRWVRGLGLAYTKIFWWTCTEAPQKW